MKNTILVGMSGGVDSSTTALLLKEQGYNVIGATMAICNEEKIKKMTFLDKKQTHSACIGPNEKEKIEITKKICDEIGIELHVIDCANQYEKIVLDNFREEYLKGRTPNPCILCNSLIKFNTLPYLAKENGIKYDKFATGHYARIEQNENRYILKTGTSQNKDQSYFLYRLTQEQLSNIMLPLGKYTKEEIRNIAKNYGLSIADKPDSQDFYEGNYNELLQIKSKIGNIINLNGDILGKHEGIWNYTIGQRKGLKISSNRPLYVIELRKETNEVVVGNIDETFKNKLIATKLNWIPFDKLEKEITCQAKIRSTQIPTEVYITPLKNDCIEVEFKDMQKSISLGQSIVFYQDEIILGGGIIDKIT